MDGRALTPEQKRLVIEKLYTAWLSVPDFRLGQFIHNVLQEDLYYCEDEDLASECLQYAYRYGKRVRGSLT